MNSTGFIRGYMAKNMSAERFILVVAEALAMKLHRSI
jgi:hypothetical protein